MIELFSGRAKCVMCGVFFGKNDMSVRCGRIGICKDCGNSLTTTKDMTFSGKELDFLAAPFEYKDGLAKAVREYKFDGQKKYGELFAKLMCDELSGMEILKDFDMVVPIPLHEERLRERGFNQSEILAKSLAEKLGIPFENNVLKRIVNTKRQSSLTGYERVVNVRGAFLADRLNVCGKRILLTDDIYTMGETAASCSRALKEAGATTVAAAVLCKTHMEKPAAYGILFR